MKTLSRYVIAVTLAGSVIYTLWNLENPWLKLFILGALITSIIEVNK